MQHEVSGKLDSYFDTGGLLRKALLVIVIGFGALVVSWIAYMILVATIIMWG